MMQHGGGSSKAESDLPKMASQLTESNEDLIADFADLHQHFARMKEIDDPAKLAKEMEKHNGMMSRLHEKMIEQQAQCRELVSKIKGESEQMSEGGGHNH
jgi:hypothetical protein